MHFPLQTIKHFQIIKFHFIYLSRAKWCPFKVINISTDYQGQLRLSYINFGGLCHLEHINLLFLFMSQWAYCALLHENVTGELVSSQNQIGVSEFWMN